MHAAPRAVCPCTALPCGLLLAARHTCSLRHATHLTPATAPLAASAHLPELVVQLPDAVPLLWKLGSQLLDEPLIVPPHLDLPRARVRGTLACRMASWPRKLAELGTWAEEASSLALGGVGESPRARTRHAGLARRRRQPVAPPASPAGVGAPAAGGSGFVWGPAPSPAACQPPPARASSGWWCPAGTGKGMDVQSWASAGHWLRARQDAVAAPPPDQCGDASAPNCTPPAPSPSMYQTINCSPCPA